jgi:NTP pyrophosphatase (non-canonical NTP hydrolase)
MTATSKAQETSHMAMVAALVKPGSDILASLTPNKCNILHMAVGISGESGELLDAVKKAVVYNKPLDRTNVIEELGDLEFYMEGLRQELDISREQTLAANIHKLLSSDKARYKLGVYTDAQAQDRADKQEEK